MPKSRVIRPRRGAPGRKATGDPNQLAFDIDVPSVKPDPARVAIARSQALADAGTDSQSAIELARHGDDTALMPYAPTPSINPPRPRTRAAGYDPDTQTLSVRFRDGAVYSYYDVTPREWRNFTRVKSPGRAINRTFNNKPYERRYELEG